jgi:hypothetical protein
MLDWTTDKFLAPFLIVLLAAFLGPRILELYRSKRELAIKDTETLRELISNFLHYSIEYYSKEKCDPMREFVALEAKIMWSQGEIAALSTHIVKSLLSGDGLELDLLLNKISDGATGGTFQQRDAFLPDGTRRDRDLRIGLTIAATNEIREFLLVRRSSVLRTMFF